MFTAEFFRFTERCHSFPGNDITYLPELQSPERVYRIDGNASWIRKTFPGMPIDRRFNGIITAQMIKNEYEFHLDRFNREPEWVVHLTHAQRRQFRRDRAIAEADLFWSVPGIPRTGIGYFTEEGGLTQDVANAFGLYRLQDIRQLGRLHDPIITDSGFSTGYGMLFDHNRLTHSLDVRAIALLMAENNNLETALARTLEVAGLTHDTLTPAYGDGTKALDPDFFDEDLNYYTLLQRPGCRKVLERYSIDPDLLTATVEGKGLLGSLLDVADKLAYLSRDVDAYVTRYHPQGPIVYPEDFEKIEGLADSRRCIFGLWEKVRVVDGKMFIDDGEWLGDVLLLRSLMFKNLYHHPGARFLERMTGIILLKYLIQKKKLSKKDLLRMSDPMLDWVLESFFGSDVVPCIIGGTPFEPRAETFATLEEAKQRERELLASGIPITFLDDHPKAKGGTHLPVKGAKGGIVPFSERFPEKAEEIAAVLRKTGTAKLYYIDLPYADLPGPFQEIADEIRINGV